MVTTFIKGVARKQTHIPRQAVSLPVPVIVRACVALRSFSRQGHVIAAAVLVAFASMLRQCHFFYTPFGYEHLITREDAQLRGDTLYLTVRSSKTTGPANRTVIPIKAVGDPRGCPVQAYQDALALAPARSRAPLFLNPTDNRPFAAATANLMLRSALTAVGFKNACWASFHSLRRSSAQECAKAGVPLGQVKSHGMWRSDAMAAYVPRTMGQSAQAIRDQLGH